VIGVCSPTWTQRVLVRVLLVVAVAVGLCAMHVFAAALSQHHSTTHEVMAQDSAVAAPAMTMDHSSTTSPAVSASTAAPAASDHGHHHSTADCVLFLSAGMALLVVLVACAAARALRPSYWLQASWPRTSMLIAPRRGPPPWHWPRVSLCVIRV